MMICAFTDENPVSICVHAGKKMSKKPIIINLCSQCCEVAIDLHTNSLAFILTDNESISEWYYIFLWLTDGY